MKSSINTSNLGNEVGGIRLGKRMIEVASKMLVVLLVPLVLAMILVQRRSQFVELFSKLTEA